MVEGEEKRDELHGISLREAQCVVKEEEMYIQKQRVELEHRRLLGHENTFDFTKSEEELNERTVELLMKKVEVQAEVNLRTEAALQKRRDQLDLMPDGEAKKVNPASQNNLNPILKLLF